MTLREAFRAMFLGAWERRNDAGCMLICYVVICGGVWLYTRTWGP